MGLSRVPNSRPLSQWCQPTISSSVIPFSSCPQSFPASGSFQMSQLFTLKCYCWITMWGFLAPRGWEFNLGPETSLDRAELLCNKVLLKYKGDRESFWHRHQIIQNSHLWKLVGHLLPSISTVLIYLFSFFFMAFCCFICIYLWGHAMQHMGILVPGPRNPCLLH